MPTIEELNLLLNNESKERKEADNNLEILISNESATRAEEDANNRIKIANESANRAESDASLSVKLSDEVANRAKDNADLKARLAKLEALLLGKTIVEPIKPVEDKHGNHHHEEPKLLMISQEMFERQLNMLKRSAKFILGNANVEEIAKEEETSKDFLRHLNNLQLNFDNLLANKDKYTLSESTNKCIQEADSLKQQLDQLANSNWDVDSLFVDRGRRRGGSVGKC